MNHRHRRWGLTSLTIASRIFAFLFVFLCILIPSLASAKSCWGRIRQAASVLSTPIRAVARGHSQSLPNPRLEGFWRQNRNPFRWPTPLSFFRPSRIFARYLLYSSPAFWRQGEKFDFSPRQQRFIEKWQLEDFFKNYEEKTQDAAWRQRAKSLGWETMEDSLMGFFLLGLHIENGMDEEMELEELLDKEDPRYLNPYNDQLEFLILKKFGEEDTVIVKVGQESFIFANDEKLKVGTLRLIDYFREGLAFDRLERFSFALDYEQRRGIQSTLNSMEDTIPPELSKIDKLSLIQMSLQEHWDFPSPEKIPLGDYWITYHWKTLKFLNSKDLLGYWSVELSPDRSKSSK